MSTQRKWKLAQLLCLAVMLAGILGLGVSVFGEMGPAAPWGIAALAGLWGNLVCVLGQNRKTRKVNRAESLVPPQASCPLARPKGGKLAAKSTART